MNIKKQQIEIVTITGPRQEQDDAYAYCDRRGYRVRSSGPIRLNKMQVDPSRFRIVAERRISRLKNQGG